MNRYFSRIGNYNFSDGQNSQYKGSMKGDDRNNLNILMNLYFRVFNICIIKYKGNEGKYEYEGDKFGFDKFFIRKSHNIK